MNWSLPTLSSNYSDFLNSLIARDEDAARMFDGTGTNLPTGTVRWSSSNKYWEKLSNSTWGVLVDKYNINVDMVDGCSVDDSAVASSTVLWSSAKISNFASGYVTVSSLSSILAGYVLKGGENGTVTIGTNDTTAVNLETSNITRFSLSGTGNATLNAPSSGVALTVIPSNGDVAISTSGKIQTGTLISTATTGTAPMVINSTTKVVNLNADALNGYTWSSANTNSSIVARDSAGNFSAGIITASLTGNASTAGKLQTARTINGVAFDGSTDIAIHNRMGSAIASASSIVLANSIGETVHITGTTSISGLGIAVTGMQRTCIFDQGLTLVHNALSLILPNGTNLMVKPNQSVDFVCEDGVNGYWRCISYNEFVGTLQEFLTALE
jgi:hypothetical protein